MLRSRKRRREEPLDAQHLPDPIVDRAEEGIDPEHEALLADGVGLALLVVLETLTPAERLAYVLHDMFSVPFEEIGAIVKRSPEAARQLASRARRRIRSAHTTPPPDADAAAQQEEEVVEAFLAAARDGDFDALLAVLDPEIVERVDTGSGTILEVRGSQNVARRAMAVPRRCGLVARPALINGAPGWVSVLDGELYAIAALTVHNGGSRRWTSCLTPHASPASTSQTLRLLRATPMSWDSNRAKMPEPSSSVEGPSLESTSGANARRSAKSLRIRRSTGD